MVSPGTKLAPGGRLPDLSLPSATGGGAVRLKPGGRRNPVVVTVHDGGCEHCRAYLGQLAASIAELREGDAHLVAITGQADEAAALASHLPFPVAVDPERAFAARTGLGGAAVVIADQWGEVAHVAEAGAGHDLPSARALAPGCRPTCGRAYSIPATR